MPISNDTPINTQTTRTSNIYDNPNNDLSEGILLGTNVTYSSVQVIRHMKTFSNSTNSLTWIEFSSLLNEFANPG